MLTTFHNHNRNHQVSRIRISHLIHRSRHHKTNSHNFKIKIFQNQPFQQYYNRKSPHFQHYGKGKQWFHNNNWGYRGGFNNFSNRFNNPQNPTTLTTLGVTILEEIAGDTILGLFFIEAKMLVTPFLQAKLLLTNLTIQMICKSHMLFICRVHLWLGLFLHIDALLVICIKEIKAPFCIGVSSCILHHWLPTARSTSCWPWLFWWQIQLYLH